MLRNVLTVLLALAFCGMAVLAWEGWGRASGPAVDPNAPPDEIPLQFRPLEGVDFSHYGSMGHPWRDFGGPIALLKKELPLEVTDVDRIEDAKRNTRIVEKAVLAVAEGRYAWQNLFATLRARFAEKGLEVFTGPPEVPATTQVVLPPREWNGFALLNQIVSDTQKMVQYKITSRGLCLGTEAACNRAAQDSVLEEIRRVTAAERRDHALDVPFRPDLVSADVIGLANAIKSQTEIPVVVDPLFWDKGNLLRWRGAPRPLREALDSLTLHMRLYWRWRDGTIWILEP
jgi:hypothetical protein